MIASQTAYPLFTIAKRLSVKCKNVKKSIKVEKIRLATLGCMDFDLMRAKGRAITHVWVAEGQP